MLLVKKNTQCCGCRNRKQLFKNSFNLQVEDELPKKEHLFAAKIHDIIESVDKDKYSKKELKLSKRVYRCTCGNEINRERNTAINIREEARSSHFKIWDLSGGACHWRKIRMG